MHYKKAELYLDLSHLRFDFNKKYLHSFTQQKILLDKHNKTNLTFKDWVNFNIIHSNIQIFFIELSF